MFLTDSNTPGDLVNVKLITATFATLAVVALSACGPSTDAAPKARTTPSAGSSATSGSPAPSGSPATSSPTTAPGSSVDGQKVARQMANAMTAGKTAHATVNLAGKRLGEGDLELGNPPKVTMKVSQQGLNMEVRQVGGVTYIKGIPGMAKPWIRLDPKGTDPFSKAMSSMGDLSKNYDPRTAISMMAGVTGRDLGMAQVDGISTRHYSFDIHLSSYGKLLNPQTLKAVKGMIRGPIVVSYWIGEDNLPRKVISMMQLQGKKVSTEVTYSDWGKPVTIVAPPASQLGKVPVG